MPKKHLIIVSLIVSLLFISLLWQVAEPQVYAVAEVVRAKVFGKPFNQIYIQDKNGIPMQWYSNGDKEYNPLFIASEAQELNIERKLGGNPQRFIQLTDWLIKNTVVNDSVAYMYYHFSYPKYKQEAPWISALTQSVGMNAFADRAAMDRNIETLSIAEKLLYSLKPNVTGVSVALSDSSIWFMEYPHEKPYFALSGMMSTLLELNKYYHSTGNPFAKELFDKGYRALIEKLPEYDYHGYSYYDLAGTKAGRGYHQRHIKKLSNLMEIKPHNTLLYYRNRWQRSDSYPVLWQMLFNPRPLRITAFFLSFLALAVFVYLLLAWTQRKGKNDLEHNSF